MDAATAMSAKTKHHYFILYTISSIILWPMIFVGILVFTKRLNDGVPQLDLYTFTIYSVYSTLASLLNFAVGYFLFLHGRRNVL